MATLHPILSIELFHILSHFPLYAVLYSIFLTILAAVTIYLGSLFQNPIPVDIGENMFTFLTAIVGWLVTTRPAYALGVHDILTDHINNVFILLEHNSVDNPLETATLLNHLALVLMDEKHPPAPPVLKGKSKSKSGSKILDTIRTFQLKSMLALPRSLHGLCILLVVGFHGLLVPLILFEGNGFYCLIPNFIMAIYTSGCLDVAITITTPYAGVTTHGTTIASEQFQFQFHRLRRILEQGRPEKKKGDDDLFERVLTGLTLLPIPLSTLEPCDEPAHPCKIFVADRV
jgi:hypothetical protein